jgi:hypothetical protein
VEACAADLLSQVLRLRASEQRITFPVTFCTIRPRERPCAKHLLQDAQRVSHGFTYDLWRVSHGVALLPHC